MKFYIPHLNKTIVAESREEAIKWLKEGQKKVLRVTKSITKKSKDAAESKKSKNPIKVGVIKTNDK